MYRTHTVSVGIAVDPGKVYAYASNPANLPTWAPGFFQAIERRGAEWVARSALGEVKFRFAAINDFGVLDHDVAPPSGTFHDIAWIQSGRASTS